LKKPSTDDNLKMPIYEYFCENCQKKFEILVFSRENKVSCPTCNKKNLRRLFSRFAFSSMPHRQVTEEVTGSKPSGEESSAESSSPCATCSGGDCSTCSMK